MLFNVFKKSGTTIAFGLVALLAVTLLAVNACSDDDADGQDGDGDSAQITDLADQLEALETSLEKATLLAARTAMFQIELHELNEEMQLADEIPAGFLTRIVRMEEVVASVDWPEDLQGEADDLAARLADAEEAMRAEDLTGAKETTTEAHADWHTIDASLVEMLTGEDHGDDAHDDSSDDHEEEDDEHMDDVDEDAHEE